MKWQSHLLALEELDAKLAELAKGGWFIHTIQLTADSAGALVVSCQKPRDDAKPADQPGKKPFKPYYRKPKPAA